MPKDESRITETDLVIPTLRLLAGATGGYLSTSDLIAELDNIFKPAGLDAEPSGGRLDSAFSQKVRNMVSHRKTPSSFIANGLADYKPNGLQITDAGRAYLKQIT